MNFDNAFTHLIGNEGGYTVDAGGPTKFGISQRAYPGENIQGMTLERAKAIYLRDYWGPAGCDGVPDTIKFDLFDAAVNMGVHAAIKLLQHAVGEAEDGQLGPLTLQAVQSTDPGRLLFRFQAARLVAYSGMGGWPESGRGWVRRVASNMMIY